MQISFSLWCIHVALNLLTFLPDATALGLRHRQQEPAINGSAEPPDMLVGDVEGGRGEFPGWAVNLREKFQVTRARAAAKAEKPKVLLYVAAKADERIIDVVMGNVNHLKASGADCDVLLGHYDKHMDFWRERNGTWYDENVRWGVNEQGWKVHLFRTILSNKLATGMNLSEYDWVWLMDEDLDIGRTNVLQFFKDVEATGSLIVGPSFVQLDPSSVAATANLPYPANMFVRYEKPFYPMNNPQPGKRFHFVPMVEVIMPVLRPEVVELMVKKTKFMAPQDHDWGMDHVWCSWIARNFLQDREKVCAIVDDTGPILHLNYGSTRGNEGKAVTKDIGGEAIRWIKYHHRDDWVGFPESRKKDWPGYGSVSK